MRIRILICDPDETHAQELRQHLEKQNYQVELASDGKDCQLKVYHSRYQTLILSLDTQNHSGLVVLKYMRLNAPSMRVILTAPSKNFLKELELSTEEFKQLGASHIVTKPYTNEKIQSCVEQTNQFEEWKQLAPKSENSEEVLLNAYDDEFTKIKIDDFYSGNATIFDHYIRLAPNKYVKILHKGEFFNEDRLERYIKDEKVQHLYFLTKDRATYINFINMVLEKLNKNPRQNLQRKVGAAKNLVEKYVEEVYTKGLHPQLLEEGKKICTGLYETLEENDEIRGFLHQMKEMDPNTYTHHFLVSLFSTLVCKQMDWATKRTIDLVSMGSILHDIGKLKLPPDIRNMKPEKMNPEQLSLYQRHPEYGREMLSSNRLVPEAVKQIIYQHHELVNGDGFPNKITGVKIYPLAKVVAFSDAFAHHLTDHQYTPVEGLKSFLQEKKTLTHYDPLVIKAFMNNFIKGRR